LKQRAVIFDVDGVLVDSYAAHFAAWQQVAARLGRAITEDEFAATFGRRNRDIFDALWPDAVTEAEAGPLGDWKEERYREILAADFPAMDGARELVDALAAAGFALAVGSSGPAENVRAAVEGLGCADRFAATVNGKEVRRGKPDPEVFLKAAVKLGLKPRCCAVIEDAVAGVEAAGRAGMTPIAITGTAPRERLAAAGAAVVVDSLRDLSPKRIAALIAGNGKTTTDFRR
jgi:beta-phosphoglucomutase